MIFSTSTGETQINNSNLKSESEIKDDLISRDEAVKCCFNGWNKDYKEIAEDIRKLPTYSAEQSYSWCKGCKEYDTEKHCCHRFSSFIRETLQDSINAVLEDIKAEITKSSAFYHGTDYADGLDMALKIINNHISGK